MKRWMAGCVLLGAALALADDPPDPGPALWFPVGEKLTYEIYWGVIGVGQSIATTEWIEEDGRRLIRIRFRNKSNKFLSTFYPVDDLLESVIDPDTFLPVRFTKILREGGYRCHEVTHFDYEEGVARWQSLLNSDRKKEFAIEEDTRDLISFMYYMRQHTFVPERVETFRVMADEKIYGLTVCPLEYERVKLPRYGRVKSLKIEPEADFDGLTVRKGRGWIWISEDGRRLTTQLRVEIPVASVRLALAEVEGPGDDRWTRGGR
jgi:hypothetical protein